MPKPNEYQAIPTRYAGVRFRSRLEARFAAFFDLVGWQWSYEAVDLRGYIPDFIVGLNTDHRLLIECKPGLGDREHANAKILRSGWRSAAIVVISDFLVDDPPAAVNPGWCARTNALVDFVYCTACKGLSVCVPRRGDDNEVCMRCGSEHTCEALAPGAPGVIALWRKAQNEVQWHAHGMAGSALRR